MPKRRRRASISAADRANIGRDSVIGLVRFRADVVRAFVAAG